MTENKYQAQLIKRIKKRFRGCIVMKTDTSYIQGLPDLIVLHKNRWALLEVKASATSPSQPNQDYYIRTLGKMSFAAYIYPEIEEEVLDALQQAFETSRRTRVS